MTPAFPYPFFPLAPCLCVRTRYRKRPPGVRDAFSEAFGTGEGLLRYGICVPCSKWLPGVRDAFSEAFGAKNRLLRYGRDIRYRKRPSTVRNEATGHDYCIAGSGWKMRPLPTTRRTPTPQNGSGVYGMRIRYRNRKRPPTVRDAFSRRTPTTSNSPNPQKPPCPIKAKRLTDSRRPTLRLCTKT